jgi:DHA3 family macrolide efflux protein-like MFS transporter
MPKFRKLLKNRNFVLYSTGQAFSQFGDRLVQIVLIGFVYKRWPGSTFQLAKLFCFTVIPAFFISPVAGVYVDRWNKKNVLIISDLFRAFTIALIPLFFIHGESVIPIYAIVFLVFASACFFLPARLSIIPNLVPKEDLLLANSASSIIWVVAGIIGFSLGGVLAEWIGIRSSLFMNAAVYLFSAMSFLVLLYSARRTGVHFQEPSPATEAPVSAGKSFLHDFKEGIRAVVFDRRIRFVGIIFFTLSSMVGAIYVVIIVFIQEALQSMTRYIGIFSMCLFAGILLGSYVYGKVGQRLPRIKTMFLSLFLTGIFINVFVTVLKVYGSCVWGGVSAFFLGLFVSPLYVASNTIVHESTKSRLRGRIFSSMGIAMNMGFLLCMLLSSLLAEHMERFWILIACGSLFGLFGLAGFVVRSLR